MVCIEVALGGVTHLCCGAGDGVAALFATALCAEYRAGLCWGGGGAHPVAFFGWLYPVVVLALSLLLVAAQWVTERLHWRAALPFRPVETPAGQRFRRLGLLLCVVVLWATGAHYFEHRYFILPPLIVLFVEMARPGTGLRKAPFRILSLIAVAALLGNFAIFVFIYTPLLNLVLSPLWAFARVLSVMLALALLLGVFTLSKRYFAPAMAIALLPQLLEPTTWWQFPLEVTLSSAYLLPSQSKRV